MLSWLTSGGFIVPVVILLLAVGFLLAVRYAASRYRKVMPGRVGIFYGRDFKWKDGTTHGHLLLASGGRVQRPILESYIEIATSAFQVTIDEADIPNKDNVKVTVKGVATCKISDDSAGLNNAVSAILPLLTSDASHSKGGDQTLNEFVLNILKGHLRSIIGQLDIDGLLRKRDEFNKRMIEESTTELKGLGIDLKNLVIQDINDTLGYIDALGKKTVAIAKADAEIQISNAEMGQKLTQAKNAATVAEAEKDRDVKTAEYKVASETQKAKAETAFAIAKAAQEQVLKVAEADRDAAEKTAQVEVQKREKERKTAELEASSVAQAIANKATSILNAEAANRVKVIEAEAARDTAEANKKAAIAQGEGAASQQLAVLTAVAKGEAAKTEEALLAQARGTKELADAYAKMNEAGRMIIVLDRLPDLFEKGGVAGALMLEAIFKSVAAPLGQIDKITLLDMGGGNGSGGLDKLSSVVPKAVFGFLAQAKAQGLDVSGLLKALGIDPEKALEMLGMSPTNSTNVHHAEPPTDGATVAVTSLAHAPAGSK